MKKQNRKLFTSIAAVALAVCTAGAQEVYEGGRGLITTEGPTGMFMNPTSGSLPATYGTVQYCIFLPENETDVIGHGAIAAYGVTDELEVGAQGTYVDRKKADSLQALGPFVRYRLTKDVEDGVPEIGVGAYSRFGDEALQKYGVFLAAMKRAQFEGPIRSAAFHAGVREVFFEQAAVDDSFNVYGGLELELPLRVYALGEISSKDSAFQQEVPYAFGLQWRAGGINMSIAGIQDGNREDVSFYYGIGSALSF